MSSTKASDQLLATPLSPITLRRPRCGTLCRSESRQESSSLSLSLWLQLAQSVASTLQILTPTTSPCRRFARTRCKTMPVGRDNRWMRQSAGLLPSLATITMMPSNDEFKILPFNPTQVSINTVNTFISIHKIIKKLTLRSVFLKINLGLELVKFKR